MTAYQAYLLAILSSFISSIGTIFGRAALNDIPPVWVTGLVPLAGGIFFSLLILHKGPLRLLYSFKNKDLVVYAIIRTLGAWLFIEGAARTSGTNAVFLTKVEPYCVLFWSWILAKEKVHPRELVLLLAHVAGAAVLTSATGSSTTVGGSHVFGDLLIVSSMLVSGASYFYSRKLLLQYSIKELGASSLMFSGITLIVLASLFEAPLPPLTGHYTAYSYIGLHFLTFTTMYLLWLVALKNAPGWKISALRALGPLAGLPAAWLILGEPINQSVIIGGLIVIGTSFLITKSPPTTPEVKALASPENLSPEKD